MESQQADVLFRQIIPMLTIKLCSPLSLSIEVLVYELARPLLGTKPTLIRRWSMFVIADKADLVRSPDGAAFDPYATLVIRPGSGLATPILSVFWTKDPRYLSTGLGVTLSKSTETEPLAADVVGRRFTSQLILVGDFPIIDMSRPEPPPCLF